MDHGYETEQLLEESRKAALVLERLVARLEAYTDRLEIELTEAERQVCSSEEEDRGPV
jgi:hypothetical protein